MGKNILIILAIIIVLGGVAVGLKKSVMVTPLSPNQTANPTSSSANITPSTDKTYTTSDIATHKDASSCWSSINGKVYDLTSWINQHPGGPEQILQICGKNGSSAFNGQHNGQRRPESELANYLIGTLAQ